MLILLTLLIVLIRLTDCTHNTHFERTLKMGGDQLFSLGVGQPVSGDVAGPYFLQEVGFENHHCKLGVP